MSRQLANHRITEWIGLNRTFEDPLVQSLCCGVFHKIKLLRAPFNMTLNTSVDGTLTTFLDNLFQCLTTLIVKKFFVSNLNR